MMSAPIEEVQPLKSFDGVNNILELFPDKVVIRRTDTFAQILPDMFQEARSIPLDQVAGIFLHESKYVYSRWMLLAIQLTSHRYITMLYDRKNHRQAEDIKNAVEASLVRRQPAHAV
jgi:hypothetical protein